MKKILPIVAFTALCTFTIFNNHLISNPQAPPIDVAGDPLSGNMTCQQSGCHTGTTVVDSTAFTLKMDTTSAGLTEVFTGKSKYIPGKTYYMSFASNGTGTRYGFNCVAEDSAGANVVGTMIKTDATHTFLSGTGYLGHRNASPTTKSWNFQWTAPATNIGPVTFYYVGMNAGGATNQTGDNVFSFHKTLTAATPTNTHVGISDFSQVVSEMNAYPMPMGGEVMIAMDVKEKTEMEISILPLNASTVRTVYTGTAQAGHFTQAINVSDLAAGVYLLKVQAGNSMTVQRVVKL